VGEKLVLTTMRNEGPFILEWVAWYRMLGFDHMIILYNDCTDHSPALLKALDQAGLITAVRYNPTPSVPIKRTALKLMKTLPRVQAAEWVFNIDVDEFLVVHVGDGTIHNLIAQYDMAETHAIAVHWKCFGDSGGDEWCDEFTHRSFTKAASSLHTVNIFFKTLIRWPQDFRHIGIHAPRGWLGESPWGQPPNLMKRCDGVTMRRYDPEGSVQYTKPQWITHEFAQLNHYITRTYESFALKMNKPSSAANRDRYTMRFFRDKNRNDEPDERALKYAPRFESAYAEVSAVPGVMRLHHRCCMDYLEALAKQNDRDPKADLRWRHHQREKNKLG
tara:strand:+ start:4711 stop:5706 length:996 start_codon:yes stop_codon:yes gene_type:complete